MEIEIKDNLSENMCEFKLPRYEQIPDVGLYLEQTTKYINSCLAPLGDFSLTTSMVSNYVKQGLLPSPVKKQYSAECIAYLIFIAVAKTVLSIDSIRLIFKLGLARYDGPRAYNYFCREFEQVMQYIFGQKDSLESSVIAESKEKSMLRNVIITIAHKVYLDRYFSEILREEDKNDVS